MREFRPTPDVHLIHADFRDVAPLLDPADMILTDPPYGVGYYTKRVPKEQRQKVLKSDTELSLWPVEFMVPLVKKDGVVMIFTRDDVQHHWRDELEAYGLTLKTSVIWDKQQWTAGDYVGDLRRQTEMALVAHNGRARLRAWRDVDGITGVIDRQVNRDTNLWSHPVPRSRTKERHPTAKPVDLMTRAILNWTDPGDLILDPFMGGAPVAIAALKTGRRYVGVELDAKYFDMAVSNVEDYCNGF